MRIRSSICLLVAAILLVPLGASARELIPANNDFADATLVRPLPFHSQHDLLLATPEVNEPSCGGSGNTIWYKFAPKRNVDLRITAWGASATIGVFAGRSFSGFSNVTCDFYSTTFSAKAGRHYAIQIDLISPDPRYDHVAIDFVEVGRITGTVRSSSGAPVSDVCVEAHGTDVHTASTKADGTYAIMGLAPGTYHVRFGCGSATIAEQWYNGKETQEEADPIAVANGQFVTGIDATIEPRSGLSGEVYFDDSFEGFGANTCVSAYDAPDHVVATTYAYYGWFSLPLDPGTYRVHIGCPNEPGYSTEVEPEWFEDAASYDDAQQIQIASGEIAFISVRVKQTPPPSNDTFASAITIASLPFTDTVDVGRARLGAPGIPMGGCQRSPERSVWYRYTPAQDTQVVVEQVGVWEPFMAAYTGTSEATMTHVGCTGGSQATTELSFLAHAGITYTIRIGDSSDFGGVIRLHFDPTTGAQSEIVSAAVPCAVACPYWDQAPDVDPYERSCLPDPGAPGSYVDRKITIPDEIDGQIPRELVFHIAPGYDYDSFICRAEPDEAGRYFVAHGASGAPSDICPTIMLFGCEESTAIRVAPGDAYVLRVYNWSDVADVKMTHSYRVGDIYSGDGVVAFARRAMS